MVDALAAEWRRHPPVHHLVAAYLDHKPPAEPGTVDREKDEALQAFMSSMPVNPSAPALDTSAWESFRQQKPDSHG